MKILGLSANYHDAAAALVIDGRVVAASAEERFSFQKHDPGFPKFAADFCLKRAGMKASDLDLVVFHEDPGVKTTRTLATTLAHFPFSLLPFIRSMKQVLHSGLWARMEISSELDIDPEKIFFVPHHLSHAAHAFFTSGFADSAVVTLDAVGEWTSTGIFEGRGKELNARHMIPFPHSLGLFYSAWTAYLGFKANDEECSTMALATFGTPRFADDVRALLPAESEDGLYRLAPDFFDFNDERKLPLTEKFYALFGPPRGYKEPLPFDCLADTQKAISEKEQRFADLAASVQLVLEEKTNEILDKARALTGSENLCLAGGISLNAVANGKYLLQKKFRRFYIPPDPGDGGGAMGAALLAHSYDPLSDFPAGFSPYLGAETSTDDLLSVFENSDYRNKFDLIRCTDDADAVSKTAELLADGKIVGWCQGRFENGPRALGNRSILIDPSRTDVALKLSTQVKRRAAFRPYACSVTAEQAPAIFEDKLSSEDLMALRWMQFTLKVQPSQKQNLRAALHVDLSTRPQVCFEKCNPLYYSLLKSFGIKTGRPEALLNTSFNASGMPLVNTPLEAFAMFIRTQMDALTVGHLILKKRKGDANVS